MDGDDDDTIGGLEEAFGEDQAAIMQYMEEVLGEQFDADFYEELKKTELFADVLKDLNSGGGGGGSTPGPPGSSSNQSVASRRSSSENRATGTSRDTLQSQMAGPSSRKSQPAKSSAITEAIANQTKKSSEARAIRISKDSLSSSRKASSSSSSSAKPKKKKSKEVKSRATLDSSSSGSDSEDLAQQRLKLQKKFKDKLKTQSISAAPPPTQKKEKKVESSVKKEESTKKKTESKFKSRALLSSSSSSSSSSSEPESKPEPDRENLARQREELRKKLTEKLKIKPLGSSKPSSSSKKEKKVETSVRKPTSSDKKVESPVRKVESAAKQFESPLNKVGTSSQTKSKSLESSQKKPEKKYRPGPKSKKLESTPFQGQQIPPVTQQFSRIPSKDEFNHHPRPNLNAPVPTSFTEPQILPGMRKQTLHTHLVDLVLMSTLFPTGLQVKSQICMTSKLLEEVRQCEMRYRSKCNVCARSKPLRKSAPILDTEISKPKKIIEPPEVTENDQKPSSSAQKSDNISIRSPLRKDGDNKEKKRKPFGPLSASQKKAEKVSVRVSPPKDQNTELPVESIESPKKSTPKIPPPSPEDEKKKAKPVTFGFDRLSVLNATLNKAKIKKSQEEATIKIENKPSSATTSDPVKTEAIEDEEKHVPPPAIEIKEEKKNEQSSGESLTLVKIEAPIKEEEKAIKQEVPKDEPPPLASKANDPSSDTELISSALPEGDNVEEMETKSPSPTPAAKDSVDTDDKLMEMEVESAEHTNEHEKDESIDRVSEEGIVETETPTVVDQLSKPEEEKETKESETVETTSTADEPDKPKDVVPDLSVPSSLLSEETKKLDDDNMSPSSSVPTSAVAPAVDDTNQADQGQDLENKLSNEKEAVPIQASEEDTMTDQQKVDVQLETQVEAPPVVEVTAPEMETVQDKLLDKVETKVASPSVDPPLEKEDDKLETKSELDTKEDASKSEDENQNQDVVKDSSEMKTPEPSSTDDIAINADVVDDDNGPPSPADNDDHFADMPSPPHSPAADVDDSREASSPEEVIKGVLKKSPDRLTTTPKKKAIIESSSDDDHRKEDTTDEDVTPERKKSMDDDDESVIATGSVKKGVRFAVQNPSIERKRDQEDSRSSGKFNEFEMERQRKKTKGGRKDKYGKSDPLEDFMKEKLLCSSFRIPKTATTTVKNVPLAIVTPLSTVNVPKEKMQFEKFRKGLSDKDSKKDWRDKSGGREWNNNRNSRGGGGDGNFSSGGQDFRGDQRFDRNKMGDDGRTVHLAGDEERKRDGGDEPFGGSSPPGGTVIPEEPLWANDGEEPGGGDSPTGPSEDIKAGEGTAGAGEGENNPANEWEDNDNTMSSGEQVTMKMSDVKDAKLEGTPAAAAITEEGDNNASLLDPEVEVKNVEVNAFAVGAVMYLQENPEPTLPDVEVEKNLAEATMMRVAWWFNKANFENALKDVSSRDDWYKVLMDTDSYGVDDDAKSDCSFHDKLKWTGSEDEEIYKSLPRELQRRKSNGAMDENCGRQLLVSMYRSGPGDKFTKIFQLRGSTDPKVAYDAKENFQARCTVCDFLVVGRSKLAIHVLSDAHKEKMSGAGLSNFKTTNKEADKDRDRELSVMEERKAEAEGSEKNRDASDATTTSTERKEECKENAAAAETDKDKECLKRTGSGSPTTYQLKRNRSRSPIHRFNRGRGRGRDRDRSSPKRKSRSRSPQDGNSRRRRSRSHDRASARERFVREPIVRISRSPRRNRRSPERVVEKTEPKSKSSQARSRSRSPSNNRKRHRHESPPLASDDGMVPIHLTNEVDEKRALTLEGKWTDELERKWKSMETEEERFIEQFMEKRKSLQTAPEKHPDYGEAWTAFWERRYQEIEKEGKEDPDKHNFVPEWKEYWTKQMKGILDREYEIEIKEIKKRNGVDIESLRKFRRTKRLLASDDDCKSKSKSRQPPPPPKIQVPPQPIPSPPSATSHQKKAEALPQPTRPPSLPSIAGTVTPSSPSEEEVDEDDAVTLPPQQPEPISSQTTTANDTASTTSTTVTTSTVDIISTWDKLEKNASFLATSFMTSPAYATQQMPPTYLGSIVSIVPAEPINKIAEERTVENVDDDDVNSTASIESFEFRGGMDVVEVLYHMTKLEEQLGFFADKIKEFFKSAEEMDLQKRNKSYTLMTDAYFVAVLFQIRERFMSLAQTQILPRDVVDNFNLTLNGLNGILDHPHCQKRQPKAPNYMPNVVPLPLAEKDTVQQTQQLLPPLPQDHPPIPPTPQHMPPPPQEQPPFPPPQYNQPPLPPPQYNQPPLPPPQYNQPPLPPPQYNQPPLPPPQYYQSQPEPPLQQIQTNVEAPPSVYDTFTRPTHRSPISPQHLQANVEAPTSVYDTFTRPTRRPPISPSPTSHQHPSGGALLNFPHGQRRESNVYDTFTRPSSSERVFSNPFRNLPQETKQEFATQLTHFLIHMGKQNLPDNELREMLWKMSSRSAVPTVPKPCAVSSAILERWRIRNRESPRFYQSSSNFQSVPTRAVMPEMPSVVPRFHTPLPRSGPRPLLSLGYDRRGTNDGSGSTWSGGSWQHGQRQNTPRNDRDDYMSSNYTSSSSAAATGRPPSYNRHNIPRNPNLSYPYRDGSM